ncbi:putative protein YcjX [Vibrio stylophorae]|uniref:YcjX family protein n=1 Tax=Vibrio stylophorae TaxID=659351 RepID=A0ABM8ZUW9_9VIBR|nr:YcjX family protein [Vibrio stylophorae]CAH0533775.1 putative protein YcjX [Vibrio stylophorae]
MKNALGRQVQHWIARGRDRHIRLAVTGLSRAGKTAFITALTHQLLHSATQDNLPLFQVAREGRLLGAKRVLSPQLLTPSFAYEQGMAALSSQPPHWPEPTKDVSEISLALRYQPNRGASKLLGQTATLQLDIVDYPGEWLLDLPMLTQDYADWSSQQLALMQGARQSFAGDFAAAVAKLEVNQSADESMLATLAAHYKDYLMACKQQGFQWLQPGRMVLPGELEGAPVLAFFPVPWSLEVMKAAPAGSVGEVLLQRYSAYQQQVIRPFYRDYFTKFDRQVVLVDCLTPLNEGAEAFADLQQALTQLMHSFRYGKRSLFRRFFSPRIDRVLFAATKADHVTPEQHCHLIALLKQLIQSAQQEAAFEGIGFDCMTLASIQATKVGSVVYQGHRYPALQGIDLNGQTIQRYPGEVPAKLPNAEFWQRQGFSFLSFAPQPFEQGEKLPHIRMDKALQFLLGDKVE